MRSCKFFCGTLIPHRSGLKTYFIKLYWLISKITWPLTNDHWLFIVFYLPFRGLSLKMTIASLFKDCISFLLMFHIIPSGLHNIKLLPHHAYRKISGGSATFAPFPSLLNTKYMLNYTINFNIWRSWVILFNTKSKGGGGGQKISLGDVTHTTLQIPFI